MKRYGISFKDVDGKYAEFAELRFLGVVSALVLALLFGEWWIAGIGIALYCLGLLAEFSPGPIILMTCAVPITSFSVFCLRLTVNGEFVLAALLYGGISTYLVVDAMQIQRELKNN